MTKREERSDIEEKRGQEYQKCLYVYFRVKFICADLIFVFLRKSTTEKCLHMLRSDYRELVNSKVL